MRNPGENTREGQTAFRDWLLEQMRVREWTQVDLAKHAGVSKAVVNKWLKPPWDKDYRRPTLESCTRLAAALGVSRDKVLRLAGYAPEGEGRSLTPLQQDVIAVVSMLPDPLLEVIYPQLRTLMDRRVQGQIARGLADHFAGLRQRGELPPPDDGGAHLPVGGGAAGRR